MAVVWFTFLLNLQLGNGWWMMIIEGGDMTASVLSYTFFAAFALMFVLVYTSFIPLVLVLLSRAAKATKSPDIERALTARCEQVEAFMTGYMLPAMTYAMAASLLSTVWVHRYDIVGMM